MGLQGLPTWITYKDYLQGLTTRITYKDYLQGLPTIVSCYAAVMWINKGSLLGILNSLPLRQTLTISRKFPIIPQKIPAHVIIPRKFPIIPRKIPAHVIIPQKFPIIPRKIAIIMCQTLREKILAHMIIPRKLKREDTSTYDNTTEA